MAELKTWKLTSRQGSLLGVVGFIIWAIGAALDGASTLAILVIPPMLALWASIVLLVDRWVRNGINQPG
jgi:hypothetical protein